MHASIAVMFLMISLLAAAAHRQPGEVRAILSQLQYPLSLALYQLHGLVGRI
jgi:hypothetical protein